METILHYLTSPGVVSVNIPWGSGGVCKATTVQQYPVASPGRGVRWCKILSINWI